MFLAELAELWIRTNIGCSFWCPLGVRLTIERVNAVSCLAESATSRVDDPRSTLGSNEAQLTFVQLYVCSLTVIGFKRVIPFIKGSRADLADRHSTFGGELFVFIRAYEPHPPISESVTHRLYS